MPCDWQKVTLGRTGLSVSPLGIGSAYGVGEADVERAFDRGVNYLYWGSVRTPAFGAAVRNIARRRRDELALVVQSYTRAAAWMGRSLDRALRTLGVDYVDVLLLGWWDEPPAPRIVDAARELCVKGKARHIAISCHHRPTFERYIADETYGVIMVRYNAAHPGAESEVFPHLQHATMKPPGVVAYTATRWGQLVDPATTPRGERTPTASDCYRFALSNPSVSVCLTGPRNGRELDEALVALDRGPLSDDELAWMRRVGVAVRSQGRGRALAMRVIDRAVSFVSRF